MSDKLKTLFHGRARAGCIAAICSFVFLAVLSSTSATAADKTVWAKYNNAVPPDTSDSTNWGDGRIPLGTDGQGDDYFVMYQAVIKDGSTYKMWYPGHDGTNWRTYHATLDALPKGIIFYGY